jgi:uncharacterized protein YdeI (YjbR/CyaY-like superfamily)
MKNTQRPYRRERYSMPDDVIQTIRDRGLEEAYRARPPYQRNDYIGWISSAVRPETRQKRLQQMLDELAAGHGYMNMRWQPKREA